MELNDKLKKEVNRSGFPLQIALEHRVSTSFDTHGWEVCSKEHSWRNNDTGTSGFIDLVLHNDMPAKSIMIIECKRVQNSYWIFLNPSNSGNKRRRARTWVSHLGNIRRFNWTDISIDPPTLESAFCVIPGQDPKSKPMLERVAADVMESTEGLVQEDWSVLRKSGESREFRIYHSVIVTTAEIKVCDFLPASVSISNGTLSEANFHSTPYLRFRKQLSKNRDIKQVYKYGDSRFIEKENTVFIVNSDYFIEFLKNFEIPESSLQNI